MVEVEAKKVVLKNLAGEYLVPITEPYIAGDGIKIEDNTISADINRIAEDVVDLKVELDGIFVNSERAIVSNANMTTSIVTYSLADYLPNDVNVYEVWLDGNITTGSTSNDYGNLYIGSDLTNGTIGICGTRTQTGATMTTYGTIVIPIGIGRYIKVGKNDRPTSTYTIRAFGYRKIRG